jgi:hypothetical protein
VRRLRSRGSWAEGSWKLFAVATAGTVRRRRGRFELGSAALVGATEVDAGDGVCVRAIVTTDGAVTVTVRTRFARLLGARDRGRVVELRCALHGIAREPLLELRRRADGRLLRYPLFGTGGVRRALVPIADLCDAPAPLEAIATGMLDRRDVWAASVTGPGARHALVVAEPAVSGDEPDIRVGRSRSGDAELVVRLPARAPAVAQPQAPRLRTRQEAGPRSAGR